MQTDIVERAHSQRMQEWERLVNLLHEADALQQRLLHDIDPKVCYEFHITLDRIADDLECYAAAEEQKNNKEK